MLGGLLTIRDSKFGRFREVPLHPSASEALAGYPARREARHPLAVGKRSIALGLRNLPAGLEDSIRSRSPMAWFSGRRRVAVEQGNPIPRARTYCPVSASSAISASATMIAKPRARKMLPADATTLTVPTTGAIPIMIA